MKNKLLFLLIPSLLLSSCNKTIKLANANIDFNINDILDAVDQKPAKVVILLGQSNASGVSYTDYLNDNYNDVYQEYSEPFNNVLINYYVDNGNNTSGGTFVPTTFGMGAYTSTFGPEVGIAKKLNEAYKEETTFILKYTWSGTVLDYHWLNAKYDRGDLYKASLNFLTTSLDYLISKGYKVNADTICWMQGEGDSIAPYTNRYYKNTSKFVSYYRNDLKKYYQDHLYFIDAEIEALYKWWPNPEAINEAKKKFADESIYNILIKTNEMGLRTDKEPFNNPDIAHYDSMSMIQLGEAFGSNSVRE